MTASSASPASSTARAQQQAVKVYGFDESHTGILRSADVSALLNGLLTAAAD